MDKLVTREGTITSYRCQLASGTLILLRFLSPVIAADVLLALPALYTFPHVQSVRIVAWTLSAFKSMSPRQTHLLINLQFVLLSLDIFIISIHHRRVYCNLLWKKVHAMERYIRDYIRLYKRPCSPRSSLLPYTDTMVLNPKIFFHLSFSPSSSSLFPRCRIPAIWHFFPFVWYHDKRKSCWRVESPPTFNCVSNSSPKRDREESSE